jgi:hypothetical protein
LRSNTDDSIREYVLYALHDGNWRAWHTSETPCAPDSRRFRRRTAASGYCVPRCRRARLFVIEAILPETPSPHSAIWRDLHMLVALGGRERTESEWRSLLNRHGFMVDRIERLPGPDAVIEIHKHA